MKPARIGKTLSSSTPAGQMSCILNKVGAKRLERHPFVDNWVSLYQLPSATRPALCQCRIALQSLSSLDVTPFLLVGRQSIIRMAYRACSGRVSGLSALMKLTRQPPRISRANSWKFDARSYAFWAVANLYDVPITIIYAIVSIITFTGTTPDRVAIRVEVPAETL
jgi:hypothetical protein